MIQNTLQQVNSSLIKKPHPLPLFNKNLYPYSRQYPPYYYYNHPSLAHHYIPSEYESQTLWMSFQDKSYQDSYPYSLSLTPPYYSPSHIHHLHPNHSLHIHIPSKLKKINLRQQITEIFSSSKAYLTNFPPVKLFLNKNYHSVIKTNQSHHQQKRSSSKPLSKPSFLGLNKEKISTGPKCTQPYMRIPNKFLTLLKPKRVRFSKKSTLEEPFQTSFHQRAYIFSISLGISSSILESILSSSICGLISGLILDLIDSPLTLIPSLSAAKPKAIEAVNSENNTITNLIFFINSTYTKNILIVKFSTNYN